MESIGEFWAKSNPTIPTSSEHSSKGLSAIGCSARRHRGFLAAGPVDWGLSARCTNTWMFSSGGTAGTQRTQVDCGVNRGWILMEWKCGWGGNGAIRTRGTTKLGARSSGRWMGFGVSNQNGDTAPVCDGI